MFVSESEFKGNKVLEIRHYEDDKFPIVSFGVSKASAILECVNEIQEFVSKYGKGSN